MAHCGGGGEACSQTLKHQNGVEFYFQSICKHHKYLWRKNAHFFALLVPFFLLIKPKTKNPTFLNRCPLWAGGGDGC